MEAQTEKIQEMFNKKIDDFKNKQTITEMKNTLEGINSRINETEEQLSELEDRVVEITATIVPTVGQNNEKRMKRNEDSPRDLWDNTKCTKIHITEIPEGEEKEKGPKKILEKITAENFPNMGKETLKSRKCRKSNTG